MTSRHIQPIWGQKRGENFLDGGTAFYDTYRTKDDQYMSVGALEPQFFEKLRTGKFCFHYYNATLRALCEGHFTT